MVKTYWILYLIWHTQARRTYLGITTNLSRRLRQHRCEVAGGSKYTTSIQKSNNLGSWVLCLAVAGFSSRSEATRWEILLKKAASGLPERKKAMESLVEGNLPKKLKNKWTIPPNLWLIKDTLI